MTIDEAITYNNDLKAGLDLHLMQQYAKALDLSNEALKTIALYRRSKTIDAYVLLSGETKE